MKSTNRIGIAVLTGLSVFLLFIGLVFVWNGWLQPEPQYTVNSFHEVIIKEISLSSVNLFLDVIILFLPCYLISFFFTSKVLSIKKRTFFVLVTVLLLSLLSISHAILQSLELWQPIEQSTHSISNRIFSRGRGGGLGFEKAYFVDFTTSSSNLSFIQNDIIPALEAYGYFPHDFGVTIGRKEYTTATDIPLNAFHVQTISEVPFSVPLIQLDYANIGFQKKNKGGLILSIDNYQGNGIVQGHLGDFY